MRLATVRDRQLTGIFPSSAGVKSGCITQTKSTRFTSVAAWQPSFPAQLRLPTTLFLFWLLVAIASHAQIVIFGGIQTQIGGGLNPPLNQPQGIALDQNRNLYIADYNHARIVEIPFVNGAYGSPTVLISNVCVQGIAVDLQEDVYAAGPNCGPGGYGGADEYKYASGSYTGPYTVLNVPTWGLTSDSHGNIYAAVNEYVYELPCYPCAGSWQWLAPDEGGGLYNVGVDSFGDILMSNGYWNQVGEYNVANAEFSLVAGNDLSGPSGVAADLQGSIYIYDTGNQQVIELFSDLPGSGNYNPQRTIMSGLNVGTASSGYIPGIAVDPYGNVFVATNGSTQGADLKKHRKHASRGEHADLYSDSGILQAQMGTPNFGTVNVCPAGQQTQPPCSASLTLTYNIFSNVNLSLTALTAGAQNLDYSVAPGSNCSGPQTDGDTCTVIVTFTPTVPGFRLGALELTDSNSGEMVYTPLWGNGQAPAAKFGPPNQVALAAPQGGFGTPTGVTVDGAGDVFEVDSQTTSLVEFPANGGAPTTISTNLTSPTEIAVDGAGNLYVSTSGNSIQIFQLQNGSYPSTPVTIGLGVTTAVSQSLGLDPSGDVFVADSANSQILEIPSLGNGVYGAAVPVITGLPSPPQGLLVDTWCCGQALYVAVSEPNPAVRIYLQSGFESYSYIFNLNTGSLVSPTNMVTDAAADIFIADAGANEVVEVPGNGGSPVTFSGNLIANPTGVGLDTAGDIYIAQPSGVVELQAPKQPQFNFPQAAVGTPPPAQSVYLQNIGNETLTGSLVINGQPNFTQGNGSGTNCTGNLSVGAYGASCNLTISDAAINAGTFTGAAVFTDNALNASSATQTVNFSATVGNSQLPLTSTTLTSSPNPSTQGKAVKFTATVSAVGGGATPKGTVSFYNNGSLIGSAKLTSAGTATLSGVTTLPAGTNPITAAYGGSSAYNGSTSATDNQLVVATTTTTLSASPNPSAYGQAVTLTATVSSSIGAPPDGETVTFEKGSTVLGTGPLSGGSATLTLSTLAVGNPSLKATYGGDSNFQASTSSTTTQTIDMASTTTTINSPSTTITLKNGSASTTLDFTVAASNAVPTGDVNPTGSVTLSSTVSTSTGTIPGPSCSKNITQSTGEGSCKLMFGLDNPTGTYTITATYGGNGNYATSNSSGNPPVTVTTVNQ
jgi:hypothetical protein